MVKASMGGQPRDPKSKSIADIDLDIKIGAVAGFNGEALRGLDLRIVRRAGVVRSFNLNGKLGVDASILGRHARTQQQRHRQAADLYRKQRRRFAVQVHRHVRENDGRADVGRRWIRRRPTMRRRTAYLNVRDFSIRGEAALDRVVAGAPGAAPNGVDFTPHARRVHPQPGPHEHA